MFKRRVMRQSLRHRRGKCRHRRAARWPARHLLAAHSAGRPTSGGHGGPAPRTLRRSGRRRGIGQLAGKLFRAGQIGDMGQADHGHLGGHHRIGRACHLVQRFQQHLPQTGQHPHRQGFRHGDATAAFLGRDGGIFCGIGGDLDHRYPMGDLGQIAQHGHRVGPVGILVAQLVQRAGRIAAQDHIEQVQHPPAIRQPQHRTHLHRRGFARPVADCLVQQGRGIARGSFGGTGDQRQRILCNLGPFGGGDLAHQRDHHLGLDPAQIKALAARQHGHGHLADLGRGEDEFDVLWRFLKRLEQRVERAGRQHVHLIDDIDFVPGRGRAVMHAVDDLADIADAGVRCGVHLHHVDVAALHDGDAMFADPAGFRRRPAVAVRPDAVHPLGDDPRCRRFTGPADAGHDKRLRDTIRLERVFQRAHHRVLPDQIGKGFRPVFAGQYAIGRGCCHDDPARFD